jgi:hypothetical protein
MRGYDRGYDYGLRGWPQARQRREPVRTRFVGGYGGDYRGSSRRDGGWSGRDGETDRGGRRWEAGDGGYEADFRWSRGYARDGHASPFPNRVTAAYNLDYVREQHPFEHPVNYVRYAADHPGRVVDPLDWRFPYSTVAGTHTWRGEWPLDWERLRYDDEYPRYRSAYGRWL